MSAQHVIGEMRQTSGNQLATAGQKQASGLGDLVASGEAWLRIIRRSHERAPQDDQFWIDVEVERSYVMWSSCNVLVAIRDVETGDVVKAAVVQMNKWTAILPERCRGRQRLFLPFGFNAARRVQIEVYDHNADPEALNPDQALGISSPTQLTSAALEDPDETWGDTVDEVAAGPLSDVADLAQTLLWAGAVGGAFYVLWPAIPAVQATVKNATEKVADKAQ